MSLEIIIGKNKTGKTEFIKNKYNNAKDDKVLFVPAEIDFDGALTGNWGTKTKEFLPPHAKIINFLNKIIIGNKYTKKLSDEEFEKLKDIKNSFDEFVDEVKKDTSKDSFFENCFKDNLKTNDLKQELEFEYNLLKFDSIKRDEKSGSSGSLNYSLIRILYEIVFNKNFNVDSSYKLVIDEIEKFLHPELIFKICNMITKISENIDVIVTTHSPIFLERIFNIHKRNLKNKLNSKITYRIKYEYGDDKIIDIDNDRIEKILINENYRFISNLSKILFSSKIFLVEGLIDNTIINDIISSDDDLCNEYFTIVDCNNKIGVESHYKCMSELNITDYYKLCLFYDMDREKNKKEINIKEKDSGVVSIINDPDLEGTFFEVEKDSINGPEKITAIKIKDNEFIKIKNFKREEGFCFTVDWIKQNSTKEPDELENKINDLKQKIKNFLKS